MQHHTVRSVLRILAVAMVAVGLVLTLQALTQVLMMGSVGNSQMASVRINVGGLVGKFGFFAVLGQALTSLVGVVFFAVSDLIATKIVSDS